MGKYRSELHQNKMSNLNLALNLINIKLKITSENPKYKKIRNK